MISRKTVLSAALTLPPDQRADLAKDIWDSLAEHPEALKLSEAQEKELERCWQAYLADPKAGDDWPATKLRLLGRGACPGAR